MTFNELGLIEPILKALETEGYSTPTPIQQQAIPILLQHRDLLGCAQTGTGKTAAFALPIIQHHHLAPRSNGPVRIKTLILTPTRELAIQIGESFAAYGRNTNIRHTVIFGGVGQTPQTNALQKGVEVLIATPGRLLDLMNQGFVRLNELEIFVLDEADRMLDMGFIHDVRKVIAKLPIKRQTLFFSATMPPEIQKLADSILNNPEKVAVTPVSSTAEKVSQSLYFAEKKEKKGLLIHLLQNEEIKFALVFSRTKHGANKIVKDLNSAHITAEAIHGNKSQSARQQALGNFKNGKTRVLVATDIAARGIDIDDLAYVFNYDLPNIPETYVHRIGRTGRAGASGQAISFCDMEERAYLRDIEKLIGRKVPIVEMETGMRAQFAASSANDVNDDRGPRPQGRNNNSRPQTSRPQQERRSETSFGAAPGERRAAQKQTQTERRDERPARPSQDRPQTTERREGGFVREGRPQNDRREGRPQERREGGRSESRPNTQGGNRREGAPQSRPQGDRRHTPDRNNPSKGFAGGGNRPARPQGQAVKQGQTKASNMDWKDLDEFNW